MQTKVRRVPTGLSKNQMGLPDPKDIHTGLACTMILGDN